MSYRARIKFLLLCLLVSFFVFTDARVLFFFYHKSRLGDPGPADFLRSLFYGLRFDLVAVSVINMPFIFLAAFPLSFFYSRFFRIILKAIFIATNMVGLLANMVDTAYFPYTLRRSTFDAIHFFIEKNDAGTLLPVFLVDFWPLVVIFLFWLLALVWLYKVIERYMLFPYHQEENTPKKLGVRFLCLSFLISFSIIGYRGGLQLMPLNIIDAGGLVKPQHIPLVLNTPFCLIKSGALYTVEEKNYMSEAEAEQLFDPVKKYNFPDSQFKKLNVVVIIIESLSKEYTGLSKRGSYTPFLDSLMEKSLVYTNAFSNGKRSIEGIPAVVASLPSFQYDYISTVYCNNEIMSLAGILKTKGYYSSFFHGGSNGTMNFDGFCATAGFMKYFGRKEYNNENDYDNDWGIWDEPFLQRMAVELEKQPEPFVSTVFTLSSHHPYQIPAVYKDKFPEGKLPIHKCIRYADYSVKRFFQSAQNQKWFHNTLFVITGDHTGISEDYIYSNPCGSYRVPLIFYLPDNSLKGKDENVAQQTDVMPTVLGYMRYNAPFFSFGTNLLDSTQKDKRFATNYYNVTYQYLTNEYLIQFNGDRPAGLFKYRSDTALDLNLLDNDFNLTLNLAKKAQAFLQQYNNRLIHNRTYVK